MSSREAVIKTFLFNIYSIFVIYPISGIKSPMSGIVTLCIFINNNIQRVIMILQNKTHCLLSVDASNIPRSMAFIL